MVPFASPSARKFWRALPVVVLSWAGCSADNADPCFSTAGACVNVSLSGPVTLDAIELGVSGPVQLAQTVTLPAGQRTLPLTLALPLPADTPSSGSATLGGLALLAGQPVGTGHTTVALDGGHSYAALILMPTTTPSCTDGVKDGDETDVDCGGDCPPCGNGLMCEVPADCKSRLCTANLCQATACTSPQLNGSETDVGCGGGMCPPCKSGKMCKLDSDCQSAHCLTGTCTDPPTLTLVSPGLGPTTGGTAVTLTGGNFSSAVNLSVLFGVLPAASVTVSSATQLIATSPASLGMAGPVSVTVQNPDSLSASLAKGFTYYYGKPAFTTMSPVTVSGPRTIVSGDFNKDGKQDLSVVSETDGAVVLIGKGDGTFQPPVSYPAGALAAGLATADFNGDGNADLAVASENSNSLSLYFGKGDGSFGSLATVTTGNGPWAVVAGDVNGDQKVDLIVAMRMANTVEVYLGHGDGTFSKAQSPQATANSPTSVAVADLDGDGKPDVAAGSYLTNTVSVLLGHGDGTFAAAVNYTGVGGSGPSAAAVAAADLNHDGKPDLVAINRQSSSVGVLLNKGDGTFAASVNYAVGASPGNVVLADFNGDGVLDAATSNEAAGNVSLLFGKGDGTFAAAQNFATGGQPYSCAAADLLGNGRQALIVSNYQSNTVAAVLNTSQ